MIRANRLLEGLPAEVRGRLELEMAAHDFIPGEVAHHAGERPRYVCFPVEGLFAVKRLLADGTGVQTRWIGPEGAVNLLASLTASTDESLIVAASACVALQMPALRFANLLRSEAALQQMVWSYAQEVLTEVEQVAACNAVHSVHQRLCRWLLRQYALTRKDVLRLTQAELAEILGVQRTTITRVMEDLRRAGAVKTRPGHIRILDVRVLRVGACDCAGSHGVPDRFL